MFGSIFFLETISGNYTWSDHSYGGDNVVRLNVGTYEELALNSLGRDKGEHIISEYCRNDFTFESAV